MQDNNVMLSFKGEISFDLVKSVLDIIESRLEKLEDNPKTKKKVFNVLVECLQNLGHHVEETGVDPQHSKTAVLNVWTEPGSYYVATGNYILEEKVEKLTKWLDQINACSKEELRALYKEILDNDTFSSKGGGGLGFIDIARKSGQRLSYKFQNIDKKHSFFSFQIQIPKD